MQLRLLMVRRHEIMDGATRAVVGLGNGEGLLVSRSGRRAPPILMSGCWTL